jgi:hypothetical protein
MKKLYPVSVLEEWRARILSTKPELLAPTSMPSRAADQPLLIERNDAEGIKPRSGVRRDRKK